MEINLSNVKGPAIFTLKSSELGWSRVYGSWYNKKMAQWEFPAYPPFLDYVVSDLSKVYPDITYSDEAEEFKNSVKTREQWEELARNSFDYATDCYDHQFEGLADVLHNYRWILRYEMGCGKSKIIIDQIRLLGLRALILCPLVGIDNWVRETAIHSGGKLKAIALKGTANQRRKIMQRYLDENFDIMVTTYDTARRHGSPALFPAVETMLKKDGVFPRSEIKNIFKKVNDEKEQKNLAQAWLSGVKPRELRDLAEDYVVNAGPQWISDLPYDELVSDESHRIKDITSLRTKACMRLAQSIPRRVHLTGTLSHGDPRDIYPQLKALAKFLLTNNYQHFCQSHIIHSTRNKHTVVGYKNLHILNRVVNRVSSEKKLDDCVDLPERRFETLTFELSPAQKKDYNQIVKSWLIERPDGTTMEMANGAVRVGKLLQLCSGFVYTKKDIEFCDQCPQAQIRHCVNSGISPGTKKCIREDIPEREAMKYSTNPKLSMLQDKLQDILVDHKVIIWATLTEELDDIEKCLKKNKWGYVRVDGSTSKNASKLADKFNENPKCKVYLAHISTGIMITLNAAKYMIYYSRSWSLDERNQSAFRNYRIGQKEKTVVWDICAERTLELQQLAALAQKDQVADLMTKKVECTLCRKYQECEVDGVRPWTKDCVLSTRAERVVASACAI